LHKGIATVENDSVYVLTLFAEFTTLN